MIKRIAALVICAALAACEAPGVKRDAALEAPDAARSADWFAALPEGATRRQVVLGCTPCHQLGPPVAFKKDYEEWLATIQRMKKIDDDLDLALIPLEAEPLAHWLADNARLPTAGYRVKTAPADVRTYPAGASTGFYHDMALAAGRAWTADYFGNTLYGVDTETGAVESYDLPVAVAAGKPGGAHQIDVTRDGRLWITFTKSEQVIRFDPATRDFRVYSGFERGANVQYFVVDAERYIYEDAGGGIWMTHFSREILSRLDPATGAISVHRTPRTESRPEKGVHLYAAVADSRGRLWYTETHGNRFGMYDPASGQTFELDMPQPWSGPKRLAIDPDDTLWIPELATGRITRYDTRAGRFLPGVQLPIPGDYPYAIRRNRHTGEFWITGSGSDSLYRLDPKTLAMRIYRLPHRGAYTRTVSFADNGDIWTVYAAFPNRHTQTGSDSGMLVRLRPQ
jgi:virginiamycin B lyase